MSQEFKNIVYEVEKGVARITINSPPLNILNVETIQEIIVGLENADVNKNVFAVVIAGAGNHAFSAGVDVSAHLPDKIEKTLNQFHRMFHILADFHKLTIAVVNGFALGGGCELAIACDIVVASDKSQFGQPEIKVGAIATVAAALLPKLVGRKRALELIFTGDTISAAEAQKIGLVNKVVTPEKLADATNELINKLKEMSPTVLQLVKRAIYQGIDSDFIKALDGVTDIYLKQLIRTEDAVEGLKAFLEKRKPRWKGR